MTGFIKSAKHTILTGISFLSSTAVLATDSILIAIGKLQAQTNTNSSNISAIESGYSRRRMVIDIVNNTLAPPTEVSGDRYILDNTAGGVHVDWDGALINQIVTFNGTIWVAEVPIEGWVAYEDTDDKDAIFIDDGVPAWELRDIYPLAGNFAEIYVDSGAVAQSIATGGNYTKITMFANNGEQSVSVADAANNKITINTTGKYKISGSFSLQSGTKDIDVFGAAFLNNNELHEVHFKVTLRTVGDAFVGAFNGIITVSSVPLDLDLRVRHSDGSAVNITMVYGNLNVVFAGIL